LFNKKSCQSQSRLRDTHALAGSGEIFWRRKNGGGCVCP